MRAKRFFKTVATIRSLIFVVVLIHLLLIPSFAQPLTTTVLVNVADANGAVVPGAIVTIENDISGQLLTQTTNEEGLAKFLALEPGNYTVSVERAGFEKKTQSVQVSIGSEKSISVILSAAVGLMTATVTADERSNELSALPNFNNDFTPLLQNIVGAVATGSGALGKIIIDGKGTSIRLDGIDATPQVDLPSADAALDIIDSFQKPEVAYDADNSSSKTRAFSPQFGPGTTTLVEGATFNAKASTFWRGQFYEEFRNSALNARNYFDYFGKNDVQRNRFGGKVGGPLGKGSFLYFAYEGVRGRTERTLFEAVPLEAICRCGVQGLLGSLLGNYLPNGSTVLPSNVSLNPGFAVVQRRGRTSVDANALDIRFDRTLSQTTEIALKYTPQMATNFIPDGITGRRQTQKLTFHNFMASLRYANKSVDSTIRFGLNNTKVRVNSENPIALSPDLSQAVVNLSGTVKTIGLAGISTVPVATIGALIKGTGRGYDLDPKTISLGYDTTIILNTKHQLFFGVESRLVRLGFDRLGGVTYSFSNLNAFRSGLPTTTNFLSDLSGPSPFTDLNGRRHAGQNYLLSYIQFMSQLFKKRLTLTYGLRYDYFGAVKERDNRIFLLDPESGVTFPQGSSLFRAQRNNFQPRFALVYTLAEDGFFANTVAKFGVGIYSGSPKLGDLLLPIESDRLNTTINGGNFGIGIASVLSDFKAQPLTRQFQPLAFSRDFSIPEKLYKWETSLTHTFKKIYELIFLYTGHVGRQLPIARVGNQIASVSTNPDPTQPAVVVRQFDIVQNGQVLKPYGEFFYRSSEGRSNYNAASIQLKRNTKTDTTLPDWLNLANLSIQYTYSQNKGNVSGAVVSNSQNIDADYGFNNSDVRHNFNFTAVYNIWEALAKKQSSPWWGWRIAPILNVRSGSPLTIRVDRPDVVYVDGSGNVFSTPAVGRTALLNIPGGGGGGGTQVPNRLPNVNPYSRVNRLILLNPQAFAIPQPGSFGNLRRGELRGPGTITLDLGISRYLFNKDRFGVEFKMEIFNVFNRVNFLNPTASLPNALGTSVADNQIQPGAAFNNLSAGSFGIITAADLSRRVQFSVVFKLKGGFTK